MEERDVYLVVTSNKNKLLNEMKLNFKFKSSKDKGSKFETPKPKSSEPLFNQKF